MLVFSRIHFSILLLIPSQTVSSQSGNIIIQGKVEDAHLGVSLKNASITLIETQDRAITNHQGYFELRVKRPGEYHLGISHIGCENKRLSLELKKDTFIKIALMHFHQHIGEVKVKGDLPTIDKVINQKTIVENSHNNLSTLLENSTGVHSMRNGSGIAKPVVQGLYGNRLSILNNGIAQSGQQWGNDHAPEIDPLSAGKIKIIKGVSALEYKGINMGAIVQIEPENINDDPHLHGRTNLFWESNGLGYGANFQLEKNSPILGWKLGATYKRNGDKSTSGYFLRNTGMNELNFNLQLEKTLFKSWSSKLYFSSFNTELGILRGSHISNITDLQSALSKEVPFFTESDLSYRIEAPRQEVSHQFLKFQSTKRINQEESLSLIYSGQLNNRKEYDVRRSGRSDIPALFIIQHSNYLEAKYTKLVNGTKTKLGFQSNYVENINQSETGIQPLIPNYSSLEPGLFFIKSINFAHSSIDLGARYDFIYQNVYRYIPNSIVQTHTAHAFHNGTGSLAYRYNISSHTIFQLNSGFSFRNPAINELYSLGLHQGISSIEEGNLNLTSEKSFKTSLEFSTHWKERIFVEINPYFHNINDYIYLKPQDELRLTIRGAFPVFSYEQTHAQLYGFDLSTTLELNDNFKLRSSYSYIRGWDLAGDIPLLFIPANTAKSQLQYALSRLGGFQNIEVEINGRYMFRQENLYLSQDIKAAPDPYFLLGGKLSLERPSKGYTLKLYSKFENILNSPYRDYLNRLRYFADDLGINMVFGASVLF